MKVLFITLFTLCLSPLFAQYEQTIFQENFDACNLPGGWQTAQQNPQNTSWQIGNASTFNSQALDVPDNGGCFAALPNGPFNGNLREASLSSPTLDLSAVPDGFVLFDVYIPQTVDFFPYLQVEMLQNGTVTQTVFNNLENYFASGAWQQIRWSVSQASGALNQVSFRFKYSCLSTFDHAGAAIDNFRIVQPFQHAVELKDLAPTAFFEPGIHPLGVSIQNDSRSRLLTTTVNWQIDNNPPASVRLTQLNNGQGLAAGDAIGISLPNALNLSTTGKHQLRVWTTLPNDNPDSYTGNDSLLRELQVISSLPDKRILIEKFTDIYCPPCYDADQHMKQLLSSHPNATEVSIFRKQNNPLNIPDGQILTQVYVNFWPTILIDRHQFFFRPSIRLFTGTYLDYDLTQRATQREAVEVSMEHSLYNPVTRELSLDVVATFYGDYEDELAFNVAILEDSLFGYQVNAPDPNNYWHMHVLRELMGGPWGERGNLPLQIQAGQTFRHTFSFVLPATFKEKDIRLVAYLQRQDNDPLKREILNTSTPQALLSFANSLSEKEQIPVNIFPNPADDQLYLQTDLKAFQISIYDLQGREVMAPQANLKTVNVSHLQRGLYLLKVEGEGSIISRQIHIR